MDLLCKYCDRKSVLGLKLLSDHTKDKITDRVETRKLELSHSIIKI